MRRVSRAHLQTYFLDRCHTCDFIAQIYRATKLQHGQSAWSVLVYATKSQCATWQLHAATLSRDKIAGATSVLKMRFAVRNSLYLNCSSVFHFQAYRTAQTCSSCAFCTQLCTLEMAASRCVYTHMQFQADSARQHGQWVVISRTVLFDWRRVDADRTPGWRAPAHWWDATSPWRRTSAQHRRWFVQLHLLHGHHIPPTHQSKVHQCSCLLPWTFDVY